MIFAHRGLSAEHPENTLSAFRAAAELDFDGMELDVRITHDKHVVVMHDANIARTTDGVGRVADFDFDELRTHETADGLIPTLGEALESVPQWKGFWNIEIKAWRAAAPTAEILLAHDLADRAAITAMDPRALAAVQGGDIPRGLIALGPPDVDDFAAAHETECEWMMIDHAFVNAALVDTCTEAGLKVGAWTVNNVAEAKTIRDLGAEMIITDTRDVLAALR